MQELSMKVLGVVGAFLASGGALAYYSSTDKVQKEEAETTIRITRPVKDERNFWLQLIRDKPPQSATVEIRTKSGSSTETASVRAARIRSALTEGGLVDSVIDEFLNEGLRQTMDATETIATKAIEGGSGSDSECEGPDPSNEGSSSESEDSSALQESLTKLCNLLFIRHADGVQLRLAPTIREALKSLSLVGYTYSEGFTILLGLYRARIISLHFGWGGIHLILVEDAISDDQSDDDTDVPNNESE
jgi:hypothetical protein